MKSLPENLYNIGKNNVRFCFAEYPSVKIYNSSEKEAKWSNHLLFGDYIRILNTDIVNNRVYAKSRNTTGWVNIDEIRRDRLLEVNFVDIGQGDGCHIVTPEDKHIIVDAGQSDNMNRYLSWRFNLVNKKEALTIPFTVIISHSDSDHYKGFGNIFDNKLLKIDKIYHNGLVERPGEFPLGSIQDGYITGLVMDNDQMREIITNIGDRKEKGSMYCNTLYKALKHNPNVRFKSLTIRDAYLKDFDVQEKAFTVKILAPITTKIKDKDALKSIKALGKDKNGHSVILKIICGKAKILLGGDVNEDFGKIILDYYKQNNITDDLQVDVAKACHHGSNHFHYGFLESLNPIATVISSGDDESFSHPRPDAIGAFGKCGYGDSPLIFSTELARSNKEISLKKLKLVIKQNKDVKDIDLLLKKEKDSVKIKVLTAKRNDLNKKINSNLTKYGMINLRTDGERMIIAQRYEKPATYGKWDIYNLEYSDETKRFERIKDTGK